jgi:hypothetical protein
MAVYDGHPVGVHANRELTRFHHAVDDRSQDLPTLTLDLFLLFTNEGDHIAYDVQGRNTWISRAGDRLHGRDEHLLDAERPIQRRERQRKSSGGAVRIGQDAAAPAASIPLAVHQLQMILVHFWYH